ncbi:MAG: hypothetical protein ACI80V_001907 [Rhodothermales bacterium]
MPDQKPIRPEIEFDRLNLVGKAVYVTGQVARVATVIVETVVDGAAALIAETERAFRDGLEPGVEEAKILEEFEEKRKGGKRVREREGGPN